MGRLPIDHELAIEYKQLLNEIESKLKDYTSRSLDLKKMKLEENKVEFYSQINERFGLLISLFKESDVKYEIVLEQYKFLNDLISSYLEVNPDERQNIENKFIQPLEESYQEYLENLDEEKLRLIEACNQFYLAIVDRIHKEGFDDLDNVNNFLNKLFKKVDSFIEIGTNQDFDDLYPLKEKVISKYEDYIQAIKRVGNKQVPSSIDSEGWDKNWDPEDDTKQIDDEESRDKNLDPDEISESDLKNAESSQNNRKIANHELTFLFIPQLQQYLRDGLNDSNISTIRKAYDQIIDVEPRLVQVLGEENPDIIKLRGLLSELYDKLILFMKNSKQVDDSDENKEPWDNNLKSDYFEEIDEGPIYEEFKNLKSQVEQFRRDYLDIDTRIYPVYDEQTLSQKEEAFEKLLGEIEQFGLRNKSYRIKAAKLEVKLGNYNRAV